MKERPIILKPWEVRAFLDGRKTQIRRPATFPYETGGEIFGENWGFDGDECAHEDIGILLHYINNPGYSHRSPFGKPGYILWGKETWMPFEARGSAGFGPKVEIGYKATNDIRPDGVSPLDFGASLLFDCTDVEWEKFRDIIEKMDVEGDKWFSAVSMPRWASRLTLEIVSVRVERLQDISPADCYEEGIESVFPEMQKRGLIGSQLAGPNAYRELWESTYGLFSWDANPWVWVVEVKLVC